MESKQNVTTHLKYCINKFILEIQPTSTHTFCCINIKYNVLTQQTKLPKQKIIKYIILDW